jgi:hypothetical protein
METEQPKIYHHNTPRQYLLAWADADERIAWLGYGKVSRSRLTVVGGENDSYRLKELTVPDVDCLKLFIDGLREHGRDGHKRFLQMYLLPTRLKALLEQRIAEQQQHVGERGASEDENRGNFTRELKAASDRNLELTGTYHYGRRFPGDKSFSTYCEVIGRSRHQAVEPVGPVITPTPRTVLLRWKSFEGGLERLGRHLRQHPSQFRRRFLVRQRRLCVAEHLPE